MKFISHLIFFSMLTTVCLAQNSDSTVIKIPKEMMTVREALLLLENQGYDIYYNNQELNDTRIITVRFQTISITHLLNILIEGTPLHYLQRKKQIIFKRSLTSKPTSYNVSGYVRNSDTYENLIGATVIDSVSKAGGLTNQYGFFSISLPASINIDLVFSYVGHKQKVVSHILHKDTILQVFLSDKNYLDSIIIQAQRYAVPQDPDRLSIKVNTEEASKAPVFGEPDLLKTIQRLPGVQQGAEGTSSLYVRGGEPGTNLIMLDGAPVYFTTHMLNMFSVITPQAVNEVKFYKGYVPSRYGGRVSSVLDISLREGDAKEFKGEASVGLITSQLILEGPIVKEKASYIISARRTFWDIPAAIIQKSISGDDFYNYNFHDITLKVNYIPTTRDRVYLSSYIGRDLSRFEESSGYEMADQDKLLITHRDFKERDHWKHITLTGRWNHIFDEQTFGNLSVIISDFSNESLIQYSFTEEEREAGNINFSSKNGSSEYHRSGLTTFGARLDLEQSVHSKHYLRYGLSINMNNVRPEARELSRDEATIIPFAPAKTLSKDMSAYVEDNWSVTSKFFVDLGLYLGYYYASRAFLKPQPRASLTFKSKRNSYFTLSYSRHAQFISPLVSQTLELPTDSWFSSGSYQDGQKLFEPLISDEINIAWQRSLKGFFSIQTDVYYKAMRNLIAFLPGGQYLNKGEALPELLMTGSGKSYGWELHALTQQKKTSLELSYSLSWNFRQFDVINEGKKFPFRYDRRHTLKLAWQKKWSKSVKKYTQLSVGWFLASGTKVTVPRAGYKPHSIITNSARTNPVYGDLNNFQLPINHRLDASLNFYKRKINGARMWQLGAYNLYNRFNPAYLEIYEDFDRGKHFSYRGALPILPSIRYTRSF